MVLQKKNHLPILPSFFFWVTEFSKAVVAVASIVRVFFSFAFFCCWHREKKKKKKEVAADDEKKNEVKSQKKNRVSPCWSRFISDQKFAEKKAKKRQKKRQKKRKTRRLVI